MIFMDDKKTWILHAHVGDARPGGSSLMDRWAWALFVHRGDDELTEMEENLDQLTLYILDATIDDLPKRFQRHTAGYQAASVACYVE